LCCHWQNFSKQLKEYHRCCNFLQRTFSEAHGKKDTQEAGQDPACKIQLWTFNTVPHYLEDKKPPRTHKLFLNHIDFSFVPKIICFDTKEWKKSDETKNTRCPSYHCVPMCATHVFDTPPLPFSMSSFPLKRFTLKMFKNV